MIRPDIVESIINVANNVETSLMLFDSQKAKQSIQTICKKRNIKNVTFMTYRELLTLTSDEMKTKFANIKFIFMDETISDDAEKRYTDTLKSFSKIAPNARLCTVSKTR